MTLRHVVSKSVTRSDWYDWWIEDADTGRELDRGGASRFQVAQGQARRALSECERRMQEGQPTELAEVEEAADER